MGVEIINVQPPQVIDIIVAPSTQADIIVSSVGIQGPQGVGTDTTNFITRSETGQFYPVSNPSGFIEGSQASGVLSLNQ